MKQATKTLLPILGFLFAFLLLYTACKKIDYTAAKRPSSPEKFFTSRLSNDPRVQAITEFVKRENNKHHFVNYLTNHIGYPLWDKAIVASNINSNVAGRNTEEEATVVYVPFVRDSQQFVNAFLAVRTSASDTGFKIVQDWQYDEYGFDSTGGDWNAEDVFHIFSQFNYESFQIKDYVIVDERLLCTQATNMLSNTNLNFGETVVKYTYKPTTANSRTSLAIIQSHCVEYELCVYEQVCADSIRGTYLVARTSSLADDAFKCPCTDNGMLTVCTDYLIEISNGTWFPPGSNNGNNGGTTGGGETGWVPLDFYYTQYPFEGYDHLETWVVSGADEIKITQWKYNKIDDSGLDSCRKILLQKLLNSLGNNIIGKILTKMDRSIKDPNNIEKFVWNFQVANLTNAVANTNISSYNSSTGVFYATTTLDSTTMVNATDIYLAGTLMHEAVHAYLISILRRIKAGVTLSQLQTMSYSDLFDEYVDSLISKNQAQLNATGINPANHHNLMATKLLNIIAEGIKLFDNNRLNDDEYYWYLAWKGLFETDAWTYHWPNYAQTPVSGGPYTTDDSTRGFKYALTPTRLPKINFAIYHERIADSLARGNKPVQGGCY